MRDEHVPIGSVLLHNMHCGVKTVKAQGIGVREGRLVQGAEWLKWECASNNFTTSRSRYLEQLLELCKAFSLRSVTTAGEFCEALQMAPEDLSLVNALPLIAPVSACEIVTEIAEGGRHDYHRTFPVLARCTDKVFIRSQTPVYSPRRLGREVSLALPRDWKIKEKST